MKLFLPILLAMLFAACSKERPAATVTLHAACVSCAVEYSHNGSTTLDSIGQGLPSDSVPQVMGEFTKEFTALVGDEVRISAHSLRAADKSVLIYAEVDGHVQGFEYVLPQGADSAKAVSISFVVPELNRWGEPK